MKKLKTPYTVDGILTNRAPILQSRFIRRLQQFDGQSWRFSEPGFRLEIEKSLI